MNAVAAGRRSASRAAGWRGPSDHDRRGSGGHGSPRQSRDTLAALELQSGRFVERWSFALKGPIESNLVAADLDGDGLLDLAVADRRRPTVLLSVR
jgi:hypothetical protein